MALSSVAALSNNAETTTNTGVLPVQVKEERPDEAEIRELAAKMVEANKAKMVTAPRPPAQTGQVNQIPAHLVQPGQPGIMNYFSRNAQQGKPGEKEKKIVAPGDGDKKPPCDEDSARGKFGWVTLGKCHIPFIFRYGEKYCAVRMVEMKLLNKYLSYLHSDIYSCTCIRSYYITDCEARLLNEINMKHCEGQFGREPFTTKDLVVRLQDAGEFYNFLDVCYNKMLNSSSNPKDKCGFIRINGESVVPYTVRDNYKYVPLFYFEGETENLKLKADKLEGWDLAYLKFCCKVQGIRNELFASETCSVISLNDIKSYFPPGTVFEDYWPSKVVDSQLLISYKGAASSIGMWTKQPGAPPAQHAATNPTSLHQVPATNKTVSSVPPATQPRTAALPPAPIAPVNLASGAAAVQAMCNGWAAGLVGGQSTYQQGIVQPTQLSRMTQASTLPMHSLTSSVNNSSRSYNPVCPRPGPQYYPQVSSSMSLSSQKLIPMAVLQPPPLVRVSGAPPSLGYPTYGKEDWSTGTYTSSTGLSLPNVSASSSHLMGLGDPSHHQMLPPPPHSSSILHAHSANHSPHYSASVIGSTQSQQRHTPPSNKFPPPLIPVNGTSRYPGNVYSTTADVIDLSSPPQSPHRSAVGNGRSSSSSSASSTADSLASSRKLIQISEYPTTGNHNPYQVQKALVEGKMVPCINSKPFIYSELLMTLPDLVSHFFPSVPVNSCRIVLQDVLQIDLYRGNRQQMAILRDSGKCQSTQDLLPLVQVRDIMQYMPQIKYIVRGMTTSEETPAKRQRTS